MPWRCEADEGRSTAPKRAGEEPSIRRSRAVRMGKPREVTLTILREGREENGNISVSSAKKSAEIPLVAASERGEAQTVVSEWSVGL